MATTINAGRVRFVSRGTYNNSTQYYLFDLVDYNGSSYIAKENTLGNLPTNTQYWQLIAEKGNTGNTGQTGPVGPTGNGIASITKTGTSGLVDTYTITYTNGNTTTFTVTNGEDGEVTETELDVLRQKVANQQKVINQLPQVTGQGTSITLENTIEAQFTKFDVEGNSTQDGTPSPETEIPIYSAGDNENLFDTSLLPITKNGVTISKDSKGNVVLNGTPTITSGHIGFDLTLSSTYLKADTYTISVKNKIDGIGTTINQTTPGGVINLTMSDTVKVKTGTLTADLINGTMGVNVRYDVGTLDNFILNPKLEKGDKATPYSPYGMGCMNEKINDNVANFLYESSTHKSEGKSWANLEFEILNGYSFVITGMPTNSEFRLGNNYNSTVPIVNLTESSYIFKNSLGVSMVVTITNSSTNSYREISNIASGEKISLNSGEDGISSIRFILNTNIQYQNTLVTYSIYTEEQTISIPTQQPMRSIGDVRDCFVKKSDGWYERHPIFRKIFTGNETFTLQSINDYGIANFNYKTGNTAYQVNGNILCNRFITQTAGISSIKTDGIYMKWGNEIFIRILASEIDTVEKLKTWLATLYTNGNPVYIDYILETPLDLPCTEEQIQQLENKPSTYKEMTIINSEDETPAYLEVAGIYDLNNLINN